MYRRSNSIAIRSRFASIKSAWSIVAKLAFALVLIACATDLGYAQEQALSASTALPQKLDEPFLPNAIRIHEKVVSGGQPEGADSFRRLADLGFKTIISVDGAKPEVDLAARYGLRYVHIPHGYDGISETRTKELAKAVRDLDGPIYLHCHHGKHRSPAAATVACVGSGLIAPQVGQNILKLAGTNPNYRGLFQAVADAVPFASSELDRIDAAFPSTAKLPPLAEAMVDIEHVFDRLKKFSSNDWKRLPAIPDLDPAHEALILREHFTELLRLDSIAQEPEAYRQMIRESESASQWLEQKLLSLASQDRSAQEQGAKECQGFFQRIAQNCTACHQQYRDNPKPSKAK